MLSLVTWRAGWLEFEWGRRATQRVSGTRFKFEWAQAGQGGVWTTMQLGDEDDEAVAIDVNAGPQAYFVYYEPMGRWAVPGDVTHVRIHSTVRAIWDWTGNKRGQFEERRQLRIVILNEELEKIGPFTFAECRSLGEIIIPNAVRAIQNGAFTCCTGLTSVTLGDGLEWIGEWAFNECTSMEKIVIPPAVRDIQREAFAGCTGLMSVTLCPISDKGSGR